MQDNSVPGDLRGAVVSCHLERPLDDTAWAHFDALRRRFDTHQLSTLTVSR